MVAMQDTGKVTTLSSHVLVSRYGLAVVSVRGGGRCLFHEFVNAIKELGVFWAVINEPPPQTTS